MMKIVYLVSGAGGMYCGSCLHANALAGAVRRKGHDILLVPFYTPVRTDDENQSGSHIAYTGLNVYLQQKWGIFRRSLRFLDRLLDSPFLFRFFGRWSELTDPRKLGPMTVSMLQGEEGAQRKELEKVIDWLKEEVRPEVVHLSNVMLVGIARRISEELGVPVVCSLTGEDQFLESLPDPYRRQSREVLQERGRELSGLIALNHYYADFMADYLGSPETAIRVIRPGISRVEPPSTVRSKSEITKPPAGESPPSSKRFTIGFFSRVCHEKGLHSLVEAWIELNEKKASPSADLLVGGYLRRSEKYYLRELETQISRKRLGDHFEYLGELSLEEKWDFLHSLDVLCLPCLQPESKGLPVLESLACGTPVVLPALGVFPELVEHTGGGILYPPGDHAKLIATLEHLLERPEKAAEMGNRGKTVVQRDFTVDRMAEETIAFYEKLIAEKHADSNPSTP